MKKWYKGILGVGCFCFLFSTSQLVFAGNCVGNEILANLPSRCLTFKSICVKVPNVPGFFGGLFGQRRKCTKYPVVNSTCPELLKEICNACKPKSQSHSQCIKKLQQERRNGKKIFELMDAAAELGG